jgi:hypothetical protein
MMLGILSNKRNEIALPLSQGQRAGSHPRWVTWFRLLRKALSGKSELQRPRPTCHPSRDKAPSQSHPTATASMGFYPRSAIATPTMSAPNASITNAVIQGEIPLELLVPPNCSRAILDVRGQVSPEDLWASLFSE